MSVLRQGGKDTEQMGTIRVAAFANPSVLDKAADDLLKELTDSGPGVIGRPTHSGYGAIKVIAPWARG